MERPRDRGNRHGRRTLLRHNRPRRRNRLLRSPLLQGTAAVPPVTDVRGIDMKNNAHAAIILLTAAALSVAGCYTQLMTPQEFVQVRRSVQGGTAAGPSNAFTVNYNQSCVTCHSMNELNERAEEMEYYGIRSVHNGYLLSSRDWMTPVDGGGTGGYVPPGSPMPEPILWPASPTVRSSWWQPSGGTTTVTRPRTDGPTRDPGAGRDRSPVYTQPSAPPASPAPPSGAASTTTTSTTTKPASSAPAETTRSRESSDTSAPSSSRPRTDGATRDDSTNRPR